MATITYNPNEFIAAGVMFPVVCGSLVAARFYVRKDKGARLGIDDWLILPGYILFVGMCAAVVAGTALGGVGTPMTFQIDELGSNYSTRVLREVFWAVSLLQFLSLGFIKCSCLFFYRRIFVTNNLGTFNIASIFMIVVVIMWTLGCFFAFFFQCGTNFWAYYGSSTRYEIKNCVTVITLNNSVIISDMLIDLIIIVMPIPLIARLQLTFRRKLGVIGIFLLGGLALAASIVRMTIYIQLDAVLWGFFIDLNMVVSGGIYWSTLEAGMGLIAACLPVLYRVFKVKGVESLIRGVRSAVSGAPLRALLSRTSSNESPKSKGSKESRTSGQIREDDNSQASNVSTVQTKASTDALARMNGHESTQISQAHGNYTSTEFSSRMFIGLTPGEHDIVVQRSFIVDKSPV